MADSVYVPPSARATVVEVFPPGVFLRDAAVSVGALDVRYVAWREAQWVVYLVFEVAPSDRFCVCVVGNMAPTRFLRSYCPGREATRYRSMWVR